MVNIVSTNQVSEGKVTLNSDYQKDVQSLSIKDFTLFSKRPRLSADRIQLAGISRDLDTGYGLVSGSVYKRGQDQEPQEYYVRS